MVNDGVENSLMREVDNIKSCQDKMKRTLEQVNHQLGVNRNTRHQIERDLANKESSPKYVVLFNLNIFHFNSCNKTCGCVGFINQNFFMTDSSRTTV